MKKENFPYIASAMGLFFMLLVVKGSEINADGVTAIPLLTLLIVNEFAFFVTAIGAYIGIRHNVETGVKPYHMAAALLSALLAIFFIWMGARLWPGLN